MEKIGVILEKSIPELKSFGGASVGELVLLVVEVSLRFVLYVALFDEKLSSGGGFILFSLGANFDKIPLNFDMASGFDKRVERISVGLVV